MSDLPKSTSSPPPSLGSTASSPPQAASTTTTTSPTDTGKSSNPFENDAVVVPREGTPSNDAPSVNASTKPISPPAEQILEAPVVNAPAGNVATNPAVAELKAIFPDYDEAILQSVLESAGNQATAIEILLGMSDPGYKSEAPPPQTGMSQTELDEQLARRLMIEEQEAQSARYVQYAQGQSPQRRNSRYGQGQPNSPSAAQGGPASGDKDAMTEIQEQFTKAAEVGKKTFGSLFTKVKAKIQEFERGSSGGQAPSSQWMGGYEQGHQQNPNYPQYYPQQGGMQAQQQASYYDPNTSINITPAQSQTSPPRATSPPATQGYDATPNAPALRTDVPAASSSPPPAGQATSSSTALSPAAAPIDGGKLGLLPKRPVSLVRDTPSSQQVKRDDSDDDLEYAENPFDDRKKL